MNDSKRRDESADFPRFTKNREKYSVCRDCSRKASKFCPISRNLPRRQEFIRESRETPSKLCCCKRLAVMLARSTRMDQGTLREFLFQIGTSGCGPVRGLNHLPAMQGSERPGGILARVWLGRSDQNFDKRIRRRLANIHQCRGSFLAQSGSCGLR